MEKRRAIAGENIIYCGSFREPFPRTIISKIFPQKLPSDGASSLIQDFKSNLRKCLSYIKIYLQFNNITTSRGFIIIFKTR